MEFLLSTGMPTNTVISQCCPGTILLRFHGCIFHVISKYKAGDRNLSDFSLKISEVRAL